jgi:hypothetical protein
MPVKRIRHPMGGWVKLGRIQPDAPRGGISFDKLIEDKIIPEIKVPPTTEYRLNALPSLRNIYMNATLGTCTLADSFHADGLTSGNNGSVVTYSDQQVENYYTAIGGYDPNAPLVDGENPTDNGCNENAVLDYLEQHGFPTGRWVKRVVNLDPNNIERVRMALYLLENVGFAINLPDEYVNDMPSADGYIWDKAGPPNPDNGHAFCGIDVLANRSGAKVFPNGNILIDSWSLFGEFTPAAIAYYGSWDQGGQVYTRLIPDMFYRISRKTPAGFDDRKLLDYLNQVAA